MKEDYNVVFHCGIYGKVKRTKRSVLNRNLEALDVIFVALIADVKNFTETSEEHNVIGKLRNEITF